MKGSQDFELDNQRRQAQGEALCQNLGWVACYLSLCQHSPNSSNFNFKSNLYKLFKFYRYPQQLGYNMASYKFELKFVNLISKSYNLKTNIISKQVTLFKNKYLVTI